MKNLLVALKVLALVGFVGFFTACDDDDNTPEVVSITATAADASQFSTLVSALQRVNLDATLDGAGPFTVFAPTNAAFTAAGINLDNLTDQELTDILLYHVIGGSNIASTDLADGDTYAPSASASGPGGTNLTLYINKVNGAVTVNGAATVTAADIEATNGVIHQIDQVLLPLNVVGHATANPAFTSLVGALGGATEDLVGALGGDGPFTVFAPLNSAFENAAATIATLDAQQVTDVLKYHVVAGANVTSGQLTDGQTVTTFNGGDFTVNISGSDVTITDAGGNTANVVLTDVQATNGVIHVLDAVIVPNL